MINFIKYSKIYFSIAIICCLASIFSLTYFGLNLGMDFKGGSAIKIEYESEAPSIEAIKQQLTLESYEIQSFGDKGILLKIKEKDIAANVYDEIMTQLQVDGSVISDSQFETISPVIGSELTNKTLIVAIVALLAMLLYIAFAFKNVTGPIAPFQYGMISTLMLFNDVLLPLGILAYLGKFYGVEFTIPIVTAILAVIGYSVNNNIVIFDRIRENLHLFPRDNYAETVNKSLNQVIVRCLNTSISTLFVLIALYYFFIGEGGIEYFALIASVGILVGTLSAIFLSSPLLVAWVSRKQKKA